MHGTGHMDVYQWAELGLFGLLVAGVAVFLTLFLVRRPKPQGRPAVCAMISGWRSVPELRLVMLALPLESLWEIAQFPLYTIWHQKDGNYILYAFAHCTLGDLIILLVLYEVIALLRGDRRWYLGGALAAGALFTAAGATYTVFSEIRNVRIEANWAYTTLMPIVPWVEIGTMPLLQWLLIPPLLLWLMRLTEQGPVRQRPNRLS